MIAFVIIRWYDVINSKIRKISPESGFTKGIQMFRKLRIMLAIFLLCALTCCPATAAVHLPESISVIGEKAFAGVPVKEILLPDTLKEIDPIAFNDCSDMIAVVYSNSYSHTWCLQNNIKHYAINLLSDSTCEISSYSDASGHLSIPSILAGYRVTGIADMAFFNNPYITGLTLPDSITTIGKKAFADCTALTGTILISDGMNIADDAFAGCPADIVYPQSVIAFNSVTTGATSTRAYMYAVAKAGSSGSFSETGLRVWDPSGNLVAETSKTSTTSSSSKTIWFDVFSDTGVSLQPNTRYSYRMYVIYKGNTYWSNSLSFTTAVPLYVNSSLSTSAILANLKSCTNTSIMPSGKREAMILIAETLLREGYMPAFTAGVISNVRYEGSFGKFESSNYVTNPSSKPAYLDYMDNLYDYRSKYSGKYIYNGISLSELSALMKKLEADSYTKGKFGLGSVQWTGSRTKSLVDLYIAEAGSSDTITKDQTIAAEMKMITNELSGSYRSIHTNWKNNNASLYSDDAAYNAGYRVCVHYEVPASYRQKGIDRGETALALYKVMMGI